VRYAPRDEVQSATQGWRHDTQRVVNTTFVTHNYPPAKPMHAFGRSAWPSWRCAVGPTELGAPAHLHGMHATPFGPHLRWNARAKDPARARRRSKPSSAMSSNAGRGYVPAYLTCKAVRPTPRAQQDAMANGSSALRRLQYDNFTASQTQIAHPRRDTSHGSLQPPGVPARSWFAP
jgi:hypothetical protein